MKRILAMLLTLAMLATGMVMPAFAAEADADVVIIGAGGAGLSAALEAVANGAEKVIILEMTPPHRRRPELHQWLHVRCGHHHPEGRWY